ncbi:hypothetical protein SAMN04487928_105151 [Butyrivibrio proteoclasticus]|uniref:Uncharacterized protein n=1 Tax=Butyrivibrio proteoclasticus TaxID=43305 RepID=A0A1I5S7V5_9FIRM|nr:hypothetical protein SAMN04487928_105151 [Butyrivibrio proteoclasticus]
MIKSILVNSNMVNNESVKYNQGSVFDMHDEE